MADKESGLNRLLSLLFYSTKFTLRIIETNTTNTEDT